MDPGLQAGHVRIVEEPGELVVVVIGHAGCVQIGVGREQRGRPCPDRSVRREVASDRVVTELDRAGNVHRRDDRDRVDRQLLSVPAEDLHVAFTVLVGHRHLMEARDACRCREPGGGELELLDAVFGP